MQQPQIIEADWTWTGRTFEADVQIVVTPHGRIEYVGMLSEKPTHRLRNRALIPGFVNVHSHAFQRGLRGYGETFPAGAGSFWSWREAMYSLVESLDADSLYRWTLLAFQEMLSAGVTTVGEFHYVRHDASCRGYGLDEVIVRAARDAGIRLVLLPTYYRTGGIGEPLRGGQRRFETRSVEEYWEQFDRIASEMNDERHSLGVAAHSVRAVPLDDLVALHEEARRRELVFHMHVEEQQKEVDDCVAAYGQRPMAIVNARLAVDDRFTAIHGTHVDPRDMTAFIARGGNVGVCPLTEGNLGDGFAQTELIRAQGGRVCIGSDSNLRLAWTEELRWLEYVQRLRRQIRGVVVDEAGATGRALLEVATENGARSLGIDAGRIAAGYFADFAALDLASPLLVGWTPESLLDSFLFGCGNEAIADVCVGGRWLRPRPWLTLGHD